MVNIIGAGLAGLSAAITLAKNNIASNLISVYPSERAQSVLAQGGINGALNTMGEEDEPTNHFNDTMHAGVDIADPKAVRGLTQTAPEILRFLSGIGVAFNMSNEEIVQRNFGGQKKKRTAYARSSTGKILMTALIDEARKYEDKGLIIRYPNHELLRLILDEKNSSCRGVVIKDTYTRKIMNFYGTIILCLGGMNGMFPERTTGTTANTANALATMFSQGLRLGNLEMIQYHPTTIGITGKRCLISEAARGEGGRLCVMRDDKPWYFMEEKYPELKNLMPRDVVSREMYFVVRQPDTGNQVYLDMRGLDESTWESKLPDLREEIIYYMSLDPKTELIPVEPGIHYFMGGIDVDVDHRTNIENLYAAGECCNQYHGANRLGGNSTMGAIYGGRVAAEHIMEVSDSYKSDSGDEVSTGLEESGVQDTASSLLCERLGSILYEAIGIVRDEAGLKTGLDRVESLEKEREYSALEKARFALAKAIIQSAIFRKESRGAHYRSDYPDRDEDQRKPTIAEITGGAIKISYK